MMRRLIVAITGASGAIYGIRALQILRSLDDIETHLILTPAGLRTITEETEFKVEQVRALAHRFYDYRDIGAAISSGSFQTIGMSRAPLIVARRNALIASGCSLRKVGETATPLP